MELWKQGMVTYLEETAAACVATFLDVSARSKSENKKGAPTEEYPGIDSYTIAEAAQAARIDQLRKSEDLRKLVDPSKIVLTGRHSLQTQPDVFCLGLEGLRRTDTIWFIRHEAELRGISTLKEAPDDLYTFIYWQAWQMLEPDSQKVWLTMPLAPDGTLDQLMALTKLEMSGLGRAI